MFSEKTRSPPVGSYRSEPTESAKIETTFKTISFGCNQFNDLTTLTLTDDKKDFIIKGYREVTSTKSVTLGEKEHIVSADVEVLNGACCTENI